MTGWEELKIRFETGKMTTEEQVSYILDCFENGVVATETLEHGLNHDLDLPQIGAVEAHDLIMKIIKENA